METHTHKQTSVTRYAEFIKKHANQHINLRKELKNFRSKVDGKGIGQGLDAWENSIAIPYLDGTHKIVCKNPSEDAKLVLQRRSERYKTSPKKDLEAAIKLVKSNGYKVLAPKVEFVEI